MLSLSLHFGLYSMAWTVVAGWRWFLDIAGVLADWNRSDMHLTSGLASFVFVARLRVAFLSGAGRLKPS